MMGVLDGNSEDEPLHYGEVFDLWQVSATAKMSLSAYQAFHSARISASCS